MKINSDCIPRYIKSTGCFIILSAAVMAWQQKCSSSHVNEYKNEIQAKANPKHYASMQKEADKMTIIMQEQYWSRKLHEVNDSIKLDSVAKKAYFEGAQMVKDSLAKVR